MEEDYTEDLQDFYNSSDTFQGFIFQGCYNMPSKHFFKIFNHYIKTGVNLLDRYSEIMYLSWNREDEVYHYTQEEYSKKMMLLSHPVITELFSEETILECFNKIKSYYEAKLSYDAKPRCPERTAGSTYTSKKRIRELIFKLHGKICLKCGVEDDITLDHVIPIKKGGKNELDNLQPLCKRCNSSKGIKIVDYRNQTSI